MHQKPLAVHRTKPHRESTGALSREASSTRSCGRSPLSRLNGEPSFLFMGAGTHACASHFLYGPRISISDTVILVFVKCPVQAKPTGTAQVAPWSSQRRNPEPEGRGDDWQLENECSAEASGPAIRIDSPRFGTLRVR